MVSSCIDTSPLYLWCHIMGRPSPFNFWEILVYSQLVYSSWLKSCICVFLKTPSFWRASLYLSIRLNTIMTNSFTRVRSLFYTLLTYLLTYSTEQSPSWEANRFSASQEIPCILWNSKVHYRIHKCPPPVPILSQLDPVHTPTSHFLKIHINIIFPSTPWSPKWLLSLRFPHQKPVYASPLPHTRYMPRPSHLDFIIRTIFGEQYRSFSSSLCSFLHSPVTSSLLGQNTLLNTLLSNTLTLRSSLNVGDQVSHPYKTTGKIIVLYTPQFLNFWIANCKTKDSAPNDSKHSLTSICS